MAWDSSSKLKNSWDSLIRRAEHLAAGNDATNELLTFYTELLRAQKVIYESLRDREGRLPSGILGEDLTFVRAMLPGLLRTVEASGPAALVEEARTLRRAGVEEVDRLLLEQWRAPSDVQFFAKALLQPYARLLAESGVRPVDRDFERSENRCPFCGGKPQVSILRVKEPSSESGGRDLMCATCLSAWPFRRVLCAQCGEERPTALAYYHTPEYDHIRIEACDTCKHYIKGVDLTRLGLAVPLVDEIAAAPLDVWAQEHGYTKIELNLLGL
jgi:formate dehydrogenase accessory protein FdhE